MTPTITPRRTLAAVTAAALLAPAGLITAADAATTVTVKLNGFQFNKRNVTVKKNDRVKFVWASGTHNLIGPKANVGAKSSGTKTIKFTVRGTYKYVCTLHVDMTMKVRVK